MDDRLRKQRMAIGLRVRALRRAKDMTQEGLASAIGRSVEAVSNIERGASLPPLDTLLMIADALSCDLADLIVRGDGEEGSDRMRHEAEIIARLRSLPSERLGLAQRILDVL